ncbi:MULTISPECIES: 2-amino-4-hydroxy-6-hydroxymethyldihydropteridine diphosphokinase [unclassified Aliivibrio]|jgi:2-amino-4-hydroxy-6-hydroxymethyldihydropteridine diphosphokinase|uniref:2-amino-4-hydroxy-6- hydroxymethyldihydropteridine diphosphokinase n=1 Tax=unclassified Aliivibrio TaxID=2645654 RepID=UPI00080E6B79|nr:MULTISPECIES: 2-amino-4-hydroxy-6-hydroxymethyldihydropteridine diphosphokinase [unclassified Aliivibrio]OCH13252.1 2-amino-4-hydroxy-6-hydroxymethyldihydropteridine diphosphokinase [Aliivibrio sp. 1S165]OCH25253.1 2-amino-4-hydroxy-6-hydroxymethyldihydropteridine diphosphokinase [Aliivibrio sp. 1S128]OCH28058.1 2-amino-4-hydroxy-6-hydroxymethyldihydropteridine diphosphokinase [Aliivibrio sp. 1S175]
MITTYIGVGSNICPEKNVKIAIDELHQLGEITKISTVYEAEPVGFSGHNFFNLVVELKVTHSLNELGVLLRAIEIKWGREPNAKKNQDRTLDLDILLYGDVVSKSDPKLPRDDLFKFAFAIVPMMELNPDLIIPNTEKTISQIWAEFSQSQSLKPVLFNFNFNGIS